MFVNVLLYSNVTGHLLCLKQCNCMVGTYDSTVEPRLSGHRFSGLFDYPDFFSGPVFFMNIDSFNLK